MRTNYDKLITKFLENHGAERGSTSGIGLDFKTVYFAILNADGSRPDGYHSVGGANYKECYFELCRRLAVNGNLRG